MVFHLYSGLIIIRYSNIVFIVILPWVCSTPSHIVVSTFSDFLAVIFACKSSIFRPFSPHCFLVICKRSVSFAFCRSVRSNSPSGKTAQEVSVVLANAWRTSWFVKTSNKASASVLRSWSISDGGGGTLTCRFNYWPCDFLHCHKTNSIAYSL